MDLPHLTRRLDGLLVVLFVLALAVPLVGTVAGIGRAALTEEHRKPAPFPAVSLTWADLAAWPEGFTRYFADHFAFRTPLVRWQALLRVKGLHTATTRDVMLGRDGWLFYADEESVADFAADPPMTTAELEAWRLTLQHTHDWLAARGVRFVFVIGPDKHVLYPEYLPAGIQRIGATTRIDQLVTYLRERSTVTVVDPRLPMAAAKAFDRLYHRTDTHWNARGAFFAYQQIMDSLRLSGGVPTKGRLEFEARSVMVPGKDLARLLGLRSVLREEDLVLVPREPRHARVVEPPETRPTDEVERIVTTRDGALPRAVVFRDSFGSALVPFLSEHFSRAVYLWQSNVDLPTIEAEHPDVVIQEWVGRHIGSVSPYDPVAALSAPPQ